jgi:pseudaminic acid biosynthesis-associated methylase
MDTKEFWKNEFGDEYLKRNRVDWQARIPFWQYIIGATGARSVFEFGCNAGWNLSAIHRAYPDISVYGEEINDNAALQARVAGLRVNMDMWPSYDLTFTAGVLIHVPPDELDLFMWNIVDNSHEYVLAVEYDSEKEEEVEYRGHSGKLWKRPYGQLYQDMGLTLVESKYSVEGFDDCTFWLFRK